MADYSKQQSYLQSESRRKHSFTYHLLLPGGSEIRVCLKTFCSTFAVTPRRVQLLGEKILDGKMDMSEKRGGARQNIFKTVWTNKIIEHIESFPKIESHYARAKTPDKLFLSPDLNVSRMYRAFLEKYCADYQPPNKPPVTRQWYNEIFISKFNLSFARPKVDTCSTCDSLAVQIKSGDKAAVTEQELHHRRAEAATKAMSTETKNACTSNCYVLSFDMQQQMYIPQLTHSQQLAVCNLGIHDSITGKGFMYLWTEDFGGRGALEISSCLYTYLTKEIGNHGKKKLILWSDNCGGQNKNQFMIAMYLTILANNVFEEIIHKFPVKGHTFLNCDRDFAIIEKRKKVCKAYTLMNVVNIITSAAQKNPFSCMVVKDFYDFKTVACDKLNTKKLGISIATQLRLTREKFGTVMVAKRHSELAGWSETNVLKSGVTLEDFKIIDLQKTRTHFGIPEKKRTDIEKMLPYLHDDAKKYFKGKLGQPGQVSTVGNNG
ncbi:uncharacterized protein [Diabrotica undecimpunctata]|uniref:uncharacterized protein n=1 Tax=Diabrotica undecimpunctata TaxID=50387 RepID=UPI003B6423D0